ncbi:hypothetical protein AGR6A_Lc70015 [Agrobacterium sp. NCPPB 925]|nr:hypothetical protein AGR6A_Lc70015 [Agrobacterium sp. NCPPB 925]
MFSRAQKSANVTSYNCCRASTSVNPKTSFTAKWIAATEIAADTLSYVLLFCSLLNTARDAQRWFGLFEQFGAFR